MKLIPTLSSATAFIAAANATAVVVDGKRWCNAGWAGTGVCDSNGYHTFCVSQATFFRAVVRFRLG
jgi:hypothetical protein